MKFKVGDEVKIITSEQKFYGNMYNLTTYTGIVLNEQESCSYISFDGSKIQWAIISEDLELTRNRQLLFEFYNDK